MRPPAAAHAVLRRSFASSSCSASHVGSLPIAYPPSVSLVHLPPPSSPASAVQASSRLQISGPKGSLFVDLKPFVHLASPAAAGPSAAPSVAVSVADSTIKHQRSIWGLTRSLIANAVVGVSEGYSLSLRLVGVGYRATVEDLPPASSSQSPSSSSSASSPSPASTIPSSAGAGAPSQRLNLKLGFAHSVLITLPPDVHAATPSTTSIVLSGIDKQRLGQVAASIRKWRVPEPYNGKGIFVGDEVVRRKEGKKK
ncbi:60S ribosomal protein [Pseudohyphozyma bogoriensis]|nr:60S ribosomal protein [Pseudohyphozyma bogoriensis]